MTAFCKSGAETRARSAHYRLCGVEIEVDTTDAAVSDLIAARLRFHRGEHGAPSPILFEIRGEDGTHRAPDPPGAGRPVYDTPGGPVLYFDVSDRLFVEYAGALRVLGDLSKGVVQSVIGKREPGRVLAAHLLFTIPLLEVMKRRDRFALHAACLAREGRGVLLAGGSGSGKSTLTVALVRAGWDFLSDDMVFLHPEDARQPRAWGFSDQIDVSDETAAMFPELRHLFGREKVRGRAKHAVDVERAFGVTPVPQCHPVALVFPAVSGARESVLEAMPRSVALRRLAPNVLLTDPPAAQAHFDTLAELARDLPCFSLSAGTDLDRAAECLQQAIE